MSRRGLFGAAGLAAVAVTGVLSGCSSDDGGGDAVGGDDYKAGSAALKVQLSPEIANVLYPEGYVGPKAREIEKFGDDTTEFRVLARVIPDIKDYVTNAYSVWLAEKTGVKVKYDVVPMGSDGAAKINAMISGGDLPDAFMAGPEWMGGFTRSQLYVYGEQGLFIRLDKLVDENAPNLLEAFQQNPGLREYFTAPNGSMYAFPSINQCYHCKSGETRHWINKKWLEKVGAQQPTTLDELHTVLTEFKKAYPDGIAYSGTKDNYPIRLIAAAFTNVGNAWIRRDGDNLVFTATTDEFREAMKVVHQWSKEGLIDKNAWSQTSDQMKRQIEASSGNKVGLVPGYSMGDLATTFDMANKQSRMFDYEVQKPVTGPDGKAIVPWSYDLGGVVGMVISNKCKDPVTMIRWADSQFSLYGTITMTRGLLGKGWDWAKEGENGISGKQGVYKPIPNELTNQYWWEQGPYNKMVDVRHGEVVDVNVSQEPVLYEAGKLYEPFASPKEQFFQTPSFDADQSAQVSELQPNIDNAVGQSMAKVGTLQIDPNKDDQWANFVSAIEGADLKTYLEVLKKADDASK